MADPGARLAELSLVDAHCHTVVSQPLDEAAFALWATEAGVPAAPGVSYLDTQLGFALRRWCAPLLDLAPGAPLPEYLARRAELGTAEATRRLLRGAGLDCLLIDTGLRDRAAPGPGLPAVDLLDPAAVGSAAGAAVAEVVRLEHLAERVAARGVSAAGFGAAFGEALAGAVGSAVAVKSIVAYRYGLDVEAGRPTPAQVRDAAAGWLRECEAGRPRLTDPVVLRHLLWCAVDSGLPIQLHTGFGDRDVPLARADPALLQPFCAAVEDTGVPLILLHCYPYHRQAGWLAQVYPHVYLDVGLTVTHLGLRTTTVLAEYAELAPFGKLLYSSDAYGLPELYPLAAAQFRHALATLLGAWVADGAVRADDADRLATMVGAANARRVYRLPATGTGP
jgi:hypothetical protein